MSRAFVAVILILASSLAMLADEPKGNRAKAAAVAKELETFAATWEITSVRPEGIIKKEARQLVFNKDRTYAALDKEGKELWSGTFDLDPTASPKIWDHRSHESQKKGGDVLGIYKRDGDTLLVCCVTGEWKNRKWKGKPRPRAFKLEGADALMELRRVKSPAE